MLKRWCSIKEIEVCLLCEILISKDTRKYYPVAFILNGHTLELVHHNKQHHRKPLLSSLQFFLVTLIILQLQFKISSANTKVIITLH